MSCFRCVRRRPIATLVVLALGWCGLSNVTDAAIIVTAPTINLTQSASIQTGSFDVVVQADESPLIGTQQVKLALPGIAGVKFTGVGLPANYVLGGSISGTGFSDFLAQVSDFPSGSPPALSNNAGLLRVSYEVAANVTGSYSLVFDTDLNADPLATALYDDQSVLLDFSVSAGAIIISAVPEPSGLAISFISVGAFVITRRWNKVIGISA